MCQPRFRALRTSFQHTCTDLEEVIAEKKELQRAMAQCGLCFRMLPWQRSSEQPSSNFRGQLDAALKKGPQLCALTATSQAVPCEVAASKDLPGFLRFRVPQRCVSPGRSFLVTWFRETRTLGVEKKCCEDALLVCMCMHVRCNSALGHGLAHSPWDLKPGMQFQVEVVGEDSGSVARHRKVGHRRR